MTTLTAAKTADMVSMAKGVSAITAKRIGHSRALLLFSTPTAYLDDDSHLMIRGHIVGVTLRGERAVFSPALGITASDATIEVDIPEGLDKADRAAEEALASLWKRMASDGATSTERLASIAPSGEAAPWLQDMGARDFIGHCLGRIETPHTHRPASIDRLIWDFLDGAERYGALPTRVYLTQDLIDVDLENNEGLLRSVAQDLLLHYRDLDQVRDWLKEPLRRGFNLRRAHLGGAHWTLVRRRSATLAVIERLEGTDILSVRIEDVDPTSEAEPIECPSVDLFDLTPERCEFYEFSDPWGENYRSTTPLKLATLSARKGQSRRERALPPL